MMLFLRKLESGKYRQILAGTRDSIKIEVGTEGVGHDCLKIGEET